MKIQRAWNGNYYSWSVNLNGRMGKPIEGDWLESVGPFGVEKVLKL